MKRLFLAIALVVAFYVGYGTAVQAYPAGGLYGRAEYRGYFTNANDGAGWEVLPQYCTGSYNYYNGDGYCNAFPNTINSASEFISFIEGRLNMTGYGSTRARTGAAFIIQTMIGSARNRPPTGAQMTAWRNIVNQYAAAGRINWSTQSHTWNLNSYFQGTDNSPSPNDDAFYDATRNDSTIVFYNSSGGVAYALRRACGNPVGRNNITPLPQLSNFSIGGRTTVSAPTVKPGQSITFRHYVRNNGPTSTGSTNIWWVAQNMPNQAAVGGAANSGTYAAGQEKNVFNHTVNVPLTAVVGSDICERVGWDPTNSSGGSDGRGATVCARVIPDFNLTPVVIADKTSGGEGDQVVFTYQVTSSGVTPSVSVNCKVVGNNFGPGYTPRPQQDVDRNSDAGYVPPTHSCPRVFQPNTPTTVATETITLGGLTPGSRVCRSLVVNPKNEVGGPRSSAETCVVVAKQPYVQFMGNDVWAGGGFFAVSPACNGSAKITTVGRTLSDGSTAGSVTEYHAFALDRITGFGSASKVLIGSGSVGAISRQLTFANNEVDATRLGYFGSTPHCIDDYINQYGTSPALAPGTYNVSGRGSGAWHVTGTLNLRGTMPAGGEQVYYADGDVTIDQPLVYPNNYANLGAIPSLLVITRGNIYVGSGVSQIDGQFVARGNGTTTGVFYTCWPRVEPASTSNACNGNQLTVNGAVHAARVDLFRSFGADGATPALRKRPAEVFNFNSELYLNSVLNSSSQITIQTNNTRDLPPRF